MYNTTQLIKCIQQHPIIWNKEYATKFQRDQSWFEIGKMLYKYWSNIELNERNEIGKITTIKPHMHTFFEITSYFLI